MKLDKFSIINAENRGLGNVWVVQIDYKPHKVVRGSHEARMEMQKLKDKQKLIKGAFEKVEV